MTDDIKNELARFLPIAVVLQIKNDQITGRIEESFSMGWSPSDVRIWWSGKAYSFLGEHLLNGMTDAKHNMSAADSSQFVFDALSDDCPIEVDWSKWLTALKSGDKFSSRNAPFKTKPHGVWQLRALAAERQAVELSRQVTSLRAANDEAQATLLRVEEALRPPSDHDGDDGDT